MANNPCGSRNAFRKTNLDRVKTELEGENAILNNSWKANLIQELLDIGRTSVSTLILKKEKFHFFKLLLFLQIIIESDDETDYEDETDFNSLSEISESIIDDGSTKSEENNPLTSNEYLKLVFSNEDKARNLLIKRASQWWWFSKSETIVNGGPSSSYFALRRFNKKTKQL